MLRGTLAVLCLWMLVPTWATAQAPATAGDPAVALHATGGTRERITNEWRLRREFLERNEAPRAADVLNRLLLAQRDRGLARLDGPALALIREAEAAAAAGSEDVASNRLVAAEQLAPGLPEVFHSQARVALTLQPWAVHRWIQYKIRALGDTIADFQYRVLLLADLVLMTLLVLTVLGALFVLAQLARYGLNLYLELGQAFPAVMRIVLLAAGGVLLFLPFFFGFGPLVIVLPLVVLLWPYQIRQERGLSVALVCLVGAAPWALRMADRLTEAGTGITQALHALTLNPDDERAVELVTARLNADPEDWHARAVLGLAEKRRGALDRALPLLEQAAREAPAGEASGTVHNNLGNARFAAGQADLAAAAYQQAATLLPTSAAPHFNLSRLKQRMGDKAAARAALDRATQLDANAVTRWNEDDDLGLNRHVVDLPLPAGLLTRRALSDLWAPTPLATRAWVLLAGPVPELAAPLSAGVTLLACLVLTLLGRRLRLTWPCARTGRPVVVAMAAGRPERPLCDAYTEVFVKNTPVDRQIRFALEVRTGRYLALQRWATRIAALVPGLVGLTRGRPLRGALVLSFAAVLGLMILLPHGILLEPVELPSGGGERWVLGTILAALWLFGMVRAVRWPEELS